MGIKMLSQADATTEVLTLRSLEAFEKAADGRATKIIIPAEMQGMAGLVSTLTEIVDSSIDPKDKILNKIDNAAASEKADV